MRTNKNERGVTVWLTGLSGAGKSTISNSLMAELKERGKQVELLDSEAVRAILSTGLGFSKEDRDTNVRRLSFVSQLLTRNGVVVIVAAISPYKAARREARERIGDFLEVFVKCPLDELIRRDVKGLYEKAIRGEIPGFTGVSDPYEAPDDAEVVVETDKESVEQSVAKVLASLEAHGYLDKKRKAADEMAVQILL